MPAAELATLRERVKWMELDRERLQREMDEAIAEILGHANRNSLALSSMGAEKRKIDLGKVSDAEESFLLSYLLFLCLSSSLCLY